jgi:hypothetical protein
LQTHEDALDKRHRRIHGCDLLNVIRRRAFLTQHLGRWQWRGRTAGRFDRKRFLSTAASVVTDRKYISASIDCSCVILCRRACLELGALNTLLL